MARPHVLVVGGGVAGLTFAAALDPTRWQVTVAEGRPERADVGTGLSLWPAAVGALDRIGLGDELRARGVRPEAGALRRPDGRVVVRLPAERSDLLLLSRPDLLAVLDAAVPESVVRRTEEVVDPFGLARELGADLVVGADGVRSVVRRTAWERAAQRETPWVALRATTSDEPEASGEWWGRGRIFGATPYPGGTYWFAAGRSALPGPDVDIAAALAEARAGHRGWDRRVTRLLDTAEASSVLAQRIYVTPAMHRVVTRRTALVGDAAHAMTPNLGRGAGEAIIDAITLAESLDAHGPDRGLTAYQRRRLAPGQVVRAASGALMRITIASSWGSG